MKKIYTIMFGVSMLLTAMAIVALVFYGLKFGVDFRGGSVLELTAKNRPPLNDLQTLFSADTSLKEPTVSFVGAQGVIVKMGALSEEKHQAILKSLRAKFPEANIQEVRFDSIGPTVGQELRQKSLTAILILLASITLYIVFVFRKLSRIFSPWIMSFATLLALAHDILIPLGVFAFLGHLRDVEISAVFVAAILTILGYSISDTVIVFDRVRENTLRGLAKDEGFGQLVHRSIMQTLVRSLNSSLTTLLSLVAIYFFGGESIRYFALALIIGIAAGAYSSIFVASPVLVWLSEWKRSGK